MVNVAPVPVRVAPIATGQGSGGVPFRQATQERVEIASAQGPAAITAGAQRVEVQLPGTGLLYGVVLSTDVLTAANAAIVAYNEDAPWNFYDSVVLRDVNGEVLNLTGFGLFLANLANHDYATRLWDVSTNPAIFRQVAGGIATGGSFHTTLRIPVATNRRDLRGILGNQDRSQTYNLRDDVAASATIYATAPTAFGAITWSRLIETYLAPQAVGPNGPQELYPPEYGTQRFTNEAVSAQQPAPGNINHDLTRVGQTIRWLSFTFRQGAVAAPPLGQRANAMIAGNQPTNLRLKVGDESLFNESFTYRRALMWERYGFEFPDGVLLYDTLHDFSPVAGFEMGDDWIHSGMVTNAQLQVSYPAGFAANAANSLTIETDDMILAD